MAGWAITRSSTLRKKGVGVRFEMSGGLPRWRCILHRCSPIVILADLAGDTGRIGSKPARRRHEWCMNRAIWASRRFALLRGMRPPRPRCRSARMIKMTPRDWPRWSAPAASGWFTSSRSIAIACGQFSARGRNSWHDNPTVRPYPRRRR